MLICTGTVTKWNTVSHSKGAAFLALQHIGAYGTLNKLCKQSIKWSGRLNNFCRENYQAWESNKSITWSSSSSFHTAIMSETERKEAEVAACCHLRYELSSRSCLQLLCLCDRILGATTFLSSRFFEILGLAGLWKGAHFLEPYQGYGMMRS